MTLALIRQICTQRVNWEQALQLKDITHVLDFGPGGVSGIGSLTERICKGKGIQVILAGTLDVPNGDLLAINHVLDHAADSISTAPDWEKEYRPRLVRVGSTVHIDTPFSRIIGK